MTDAKILGPKGNELVKPLFFYGDTIVDNKITVIADEYRLVQEVKGRKMFLDDGAALQRV